MTRKGLSRRTGAERSQCSGSGHWRGLTGEVLSGGLLSPPAVQQVEFDSGGGRNPAISGRWRNCHKAAFQQISVYALAVFRRASQFDEEYYVMTKNNPSFKFHN